MEKDLLNKNVKIEFDNSKLDKNKAYAYIYLSDELYNTQLLKEGCATLRVERKNIDKLELGHPLKRSESFSFCLK